MILYVKKAVEGYLPANIFILIHKCQRILFYVEKIETQSI